MKLSRDEIVVILTWIPTATTYLTGNTHDALIMLVGNVLGGILYLSRDIICYHQRLMGVLKMIF
jgi:hypothetical protein